LPYGDVVLILRSGPQIRPKALEPVGIFDESACWGIWVADTQNTGRNLKTSAFQAPHLIISTVHPSSWPFLFRLKLELRHHKGSLCRAAEILAAAGVNIIFTEGTPSGYHHATVTIIGEATSVKEQHSLFRISTSPDRYLEIAKSMILFLSELRAKLENGNTEYGFLHPGLAGDGYICSYGKDQLGEIWHSNQRLLTQAIDCRPVSNLFYLSRCSDLNDSTPVEFRYEHKSECLRCQDQQTFEHAASTISNQAFSLPSLAVAHFSPEEVYIRLQPIKSEVTSSVVNFDISYWSELKTTSNEIPIAPSLGLVANLTRRFDRSRLGINLLRVSNLFTEMKLSTTKARERGRIRFVAWLEALETSHPFELDYFKRKIQGLLSELESVKDERADIVEMKVLISPLSELSVFISMSFKMHRAEEISELLQEAAESLGIAKPNIEIVETYTQGVTDLVVDRVRRCDAFLQIIGASDNHGWLHAEYGMAAVRNIPRLRLIDQSIFPTREGQINALKLERDIPPLEFSTSWDRESLRPIFAKAFEKLIRELRRKPAER
jgi:hypothetical protein